MTYWRCTASPSPPSATWTLIRELKDALAGEEMLHGQTRAELAEVEADLATAREHAEALAEQLRVERNYRFERMQDSVYSDVREFHRGRMEAIDARRRAAQEAGVVGGG